uniref:Retrotransposon gag domain-containing protein n=1 Tax=Seriola lalandi dorsalis TaxID=1841481 RepID=A0A3B4XZG7_SERLL
MKKCLSVLDSIFYSLNCYDNSKTYTFTTLFPSRFFFFCRYSSPPAPRLLRSLSLFSICPYNPATMDSAEQEALKQAIAIQGAHLGHHDTALREVTTQLTQISAVLATLTDRLNAAPAPIVPLPVEQPPAAPPTPVNAPAGLEPHIPPPAKYSGDPNTCRQFITQCQLTFNAQPLRYASEAAKVAYLVNLLEGPPLSFYNALFEQNSPLAMSAEAFAGELKRVYDHPMRGQPAGLQLSRIRQGRLSVREFVSRFQSAAVESGWNEAALITAFLNGLNRDVGREMALQREHTNLDEAINSAIKVSDQLSLWHVEPAASSTFCSEQRTFHGPSRDVPSPREDHWEIPRSSEPEPMQIDGIHLSPEEKSRRIRAQSSLYCGQAGHFTATCPIRLAKGPARGN